VAGKTIHAVDSKISVSEKYKYVVKCSLLLLSLFDGLTIVFHCWYPGNWNWHIL